MLVDFNIFKLQVTVNYLTKSNPSQYSGSTVKQDSYIPCSKRPHIMPFSVIVCSRTGAGKITFT